MGLFSKIKNAISKDYDPNDKMANFYGFDLKLDTYNELEKTTKLRFKETEDINDTLLDRYKDKEHEDIQQELMKKYLKQSQYEINGQLKAEEEQIKAEVAEIAEEQNLTDEQRKELEEKTMQERMEGKFLDGKDRKSAIKTLVLETAYGIAYADYAKNAMIMKHAQYEARDLAMGTKETMQIIAMEKNIEKLDLLYHNHTGKNITEKPDIQKKVEKFRDDFNDEEKSIQDVATKQTRSLDSLYKERALKHEKYIQALKNPALSDYEKATYKREYEEVNLKFLQSNPSLQEYTQDLGIEEKNKELVEEADLKGPSAATKYMHENEEVEKDLPNDEDEIHRVQEDKLQRDEKSFEMSQVEQKDAMEKGDITAAKRISDVQRQSNIYEENIDKVPEQATRTEVKEEQQKEQEISDIGFFNSLRHVRNPEEKSQEELESILDEREEDAKDKIQENAYEEMKKQEDYQREIRRKNEKPGQNT